MRKRILVLASGSATQADGSGSGFRELVLDTRNGILHADIVGVASHYEMGSVASLASELGVPFYFLSAATRYDYQQVVRQTNPDLVVLCGWLKLVAGIIGQVPIVNIHPAPLPRFGGKGMYGLAVHEAVLTSGLSETKVTIHWVNGQYDTGQTIATFTVPIMPGDTPQKLQGRVKAHEHCVYGETIEKRILPQLV